VTAETLQDLKQGSAVPPDEPDRWTLGEHAMLRPVATILEIFRYRAVQIMRTQHRRRGPETHPIDGYRKIAACRRRA
jgi:hypothetical protein